MWTIGKEKIKCLVDTGATTSILKSRILEFQYPKTELTKPCSYKTLNGINVVKYTVTTPFPKEIPYSGTLQWKLIDFSNKNFSAIIGQNFLKAFNAQINNTEQYVQLLDRKFYFLDYEYPEAMYNACALQPVNREDIRDCFNLAHLNDEERRAVETLFAEFDDLFFQEGDVLSATNQISHEIITTVDRPLYSKIYRYPQIHEKEINRQIKEMLEQNIIKKSNSPYNSPLWIVEKKLDNSGSKKFRIVIDYRKLNEFTVDDRFPVPNLNSLLDKLGRSQYFTTLDLAKGFHQILVREEDRPKTAFSTPSGHYEFVRMPFGLKNAPSTFQRLMNEVLKDHINDNCVVYMDDILIFSTSLQEHMTTLRKIFRTLKEANLKIQVDKCDFLKKETQFLGHILTTHGIKPNSDKVNIIQNLKLPKTAKQIKSFLGMTGFYRKFVRDYAKIAFPMSRYLKKNETINTDDPSYIAAFEKLKTLVTNSPVLRYPNFSKKFTVTTDASNFAVGAVLSQESHPIAYASRTLNQHECNYSTIEKELLAIVWAVKYFRPYVYGREFDLESDHQPLKWLMAKYTGKDISPRLQRWLINLGEYNFHIEYIKGKNNNIADFLSRIKEDEINLMEAESTDEEDNKSLTETVHSNEEDQGFNMSILETAVNRFKTQIIFTEKKPNTMVQVFGRKRIYISKKDLENNQAVNLLRREITAGKIGVFSHLSDHEFYQFQKILTKEYTSNPKVRFVKCTRFVTDIESEDELHTQIALFHKNESGHCGIVATYQKLKLKIYHPNLKTHIHRIINNCDVCSGGKYDRKPIKNNFHLTETPKTCNEIIHVDTYVNSKQSFTIFIDKFSKHATCLPLTDRNSITIVEHIQQFLSIKGKVQKFVFDNEFNSLNVREFLEKEGIEYHSTKPNSHTGNSDVERLNNTLTEKIRTLNIEEKRPIIEQMARAVYFYNNTHHTTTKSTPFEVQNHKVDHKELYDRMTAQKAGKIAKLNNNRETYIETRTEGFIKNYKNLRHKEEPKFRKTKLQNIHTTNIKRPTKFSDNVDTPHHVPITNTVDGNDQHNPDPG